MDLINLKMVILINSWMLTMSSPVAMLQHATSSQSIVFHPASVSTSAPAGKTFIILISLHRSPKYEYKYEVSDHQTGDRKSHWESREGDKVRGGYTLYEPDGALRTVEYTADALHGFNAVVRRNEPTRHHHPRPDTSYGASSPNAREGYSHSQSGYVPERSLSNSGHDYSPYTGSAGSFNSAVGFSVKHVMELKKDSQSQPY
ncbi:hypothetical protein ACJJTC_008926 [Scirpophaga incertulas]